MISEGGMQADVVSSYMNECYDTTGVSSSSFLLSLQGLEGLWASISMIQHYMNLRYELSSSPLKCHRNSLPDWITLVMIHCLCWNSRWRAWHQWMFTFWNVMMWQPLPGMTALTEGDMKEDTISSCVNRLFDKVFHPGDNPGAHNWFLESTPVQMPPRGGSICWRLTWDLPPGRLHAASERRGNSLKEFKRLLAESQGQNLALTVLCGHVHSTVVFLLTRAPHEKWSTW